MGTETERGESRLKAGPGGTIAADGMTELAFFLIVSLWEESALLDAAERFGFDWNFASWRRAYSLRVRSLALAM